MALGTTTIEQKPVADSAKVPAITNWTPVLPYTVKQTSISALYYFKFILEIRIDDGSGELLGKIKQRHNGYSTVLNVYTVFDVSEIINSQLQATYADQNSTTDSIHTLGKNVTTKPFSVNSNQLKYIYVKAYQQYSESINSSPTADSSESESSSKYYIAASLPLETPRTAGEYFQGTTFQTYQTKTITSLFLSDVEDSVAPYNLGSVKRNYVQETDYHTVAFLNGEDDFDSDIITFQISYYDADNSQIGTHAYMTNSDTYGGAIPSTIGGEVDANSKRLIYCGVGPGNLEALTDPSSPNPSNFTGWAYYTVRGVSSLIGGRTDHYFFIKQDGSCKGFKVRRLAWRNSLGCWDYFNFKMKSTQSIKVKRNSYSQMPGEFNSTEYSYNNFDRGIKTRTVEAQLIETLNTDFITEEDGQLLEKLIVSNDVFIIENDDTTYTVPVVISDVNYIRKTVANNKLIKYTIKIEYANPLNTNS
tara:strand:- start:5523 stop:6947 length:1425 start_codon:yes stop_codon:yes gene_type:complete